MIELDRFLPTAGDARAVLPDAGDVRDACRRSTDVEDLVRVAGACVR